MTDTVIAVVIEISVDSGADRFREDIAALIIGIGNRCAVFGYALYGTRGVVG